MDQSTLDSFAEDLTCPICLEVFEDPRILPCHHYYCAKCIDILAGVAERFVCPECRNVTLKSGGASAMFPPAFMVNRLKEKLEKSRLQRPRAPAASSRCADHGYPVTFVCLDCRVDVCSECVVVTHKGHSHENLAKSPHDSTASDDGDSHYARSARSREDGEPKPPPLPRRTTVPLLNYSPPDSNSSPLLCSGESPVEFTSVMILGTSPRSATAPPVPPRKATRSLKKLEAWYCDIDRSSAVRLLEGRTNGTFLCRPALKSHDPVCIEGEAHTHTIDLIADKKICHIKVLRLNGMYSLQPSSFKSRVEFSSLQDLVIYYSEHAIAVYDLFATLTCAVNVD